MRERRSARCDVFIRQGVFVILRRPVITSWGGLCVMVEEECYVYE